MNLAGEGPNFASFAKSGDKISNLATLGERAPELDSSFFLPQSLPSQELWVADCACLRPETESSGLGSATRAVAGCLHHRGGGAGSDLQEATTTAVRQHSKCVVVRRDMSGIVRMIDKN